MSKPRRVLPKVTYLITRRTILRHMLLRPDPVMKQIFVYLLAVFSARYHVQVHAFCVMSTHIHLVVTDERGKLPKFLHGFHRMLALCTRAHRGWAHSVWDTSPASVVRLETRDAVLEKIAYVLANPVAAGLVRRAHEWPGATVLVGQIGKETLCAQRPEVFLNPKNPLWPAEAALPIVLPPAVEADSASFHGDVTTEVERIEAQAEAARKERGRRVLGAERASCVSPDARATTAEPLVDRNPTLAVGRGQGEARRRAEADERAFRASYQAALEQWCAGVRDVVFPAGTWLMRVLHRAVVAGVATAAPAERAAIA